MEDYYKHLALAKQTLMRADHMTYMTYPLVKDLKMFTYILENIYSSILNTMEAVLQYDRLYKRISPLPENFDSRFQIFKSKSSKFHNLSIEHMEFIQELKMMVESHKQSNMEFIRQDKLIICSPTFKTKTLNVDVIKSYLVKTRKFLIEVESMLKKEEYLVKRED
ncbi:MAG: hypothetical protein WC413_01695 [Candidatus Nanoarchaeia archaeon]